MLGLSDTDRGKINWVSSVKDLLDGFGFSEACYNLDSRQAKHFPLIFNQRVIDCFVQDWHGSVERSSVLDEYQYFKKSFEYETYLDVLPFNLRFFVTRARISAHSLRIHTGRYGRNAIPRNERLCLVVLVTLKILFILYVYVRVITNLELSIYL